MNEKEALRLVERAKDLLELAQTIKSDQHRAMLIDSAEKFLKLATQVLGPEQES